MCSSIAGSSSWSCRITCTRVRVASAMSGRMSAVICGSM